MKIALLIPGRLDTFEYMHPTLKEYVLNPLKPDIFFSGYPNQKGLEYCEKKIKELWNPKQYLLRNYTEEIRKEIYIEDKIFNFHKRNETTPNTWLSGIYNVKMANKFKTMHEIYNNFKYDVVIKARTDFYWYSTISSEQLNLAKEGKLLIPTGRDFKCVNPIAVCDQIAISNSEIMDKYASLIDYVDQYYAEGNLFHPETYLGIHLNKMGISRTEVNEGFENTGWCFIDPNPNRKSFNII